MVGAPGSPAPAPSGVGAPSTFLILMMSAPGSLTPAPPRGQAVDVSYVDGGAPGSPAPTPMSKTFLRKKLSPCATER
jgi:hypothetical protein